MYRAEGMANCISDDDIEFAGLNLLVKVKPRKKKKNNKVFLYPNSYVDVFIKPISRDIFTLKKETNCVTLKDLIHCNSNLPHTFEVTTSSL